MFFYEVRVISVIIIISFIMQKVVKCLTKNINSIASDHWSQNVKI